MTHNAIYDLIFPFINNHINMAKLETLTKKDVEQLRQENAGLWAEELLRKSIFVTTQKDNVLEGEIVCVEPFTGNESGLQDDRRFRKKERQQGEVLILDRYGNPMLFLVVDGNPEKQEIIWIKELRVRKEGGSTNGKKMKFTAFLKEAGIDPKDLEFVKDEFDGVQAWDPDRESTLHIDDPRTGVQSVRAGIKQAVKDVNEWSLGEFHKG